jgi:hypothetical protein
MTGVSNRRCQEKERLLQAYNVSTRAFSDAVDALDAGRGVTAREAYERLERTVLEARLKSEKSRLEYEQHIASHGC